MEEKIHSPLLIVGILSEFINSTKEVLNKIKESVGASETGFDSEFAKSVNDALLFAEKIAGEYSTYDFNEAQRINFSALASDQKQFEEYLNAEIYQAENLRKWDEKERQMKNIRVHPETIEMALSAANETKNKLYHYIPERNILNMENNPVSESTSGSGTPAGNAPPDVAQNHGSSDEQPQAPMVMEEQLKTVYTLAEKFIEAIGNFTKENYEWYNDAKDEPDIELGNRISNATASANDLMKHSYRYPFAESQDEKVFIDKVALFYKALGDISVQCRILTDHYPTVFSDRELIRSMEGLRNLESTVEPFYTDIEKIALSLSLEQYKNPEIVQETPVDTDESEFTLNKETLTAITSDVPHADDVDSLDITPDVNALASIITYKNVKPPLAIGLFGNWGSGKSFFMKKLRKQIDVFAADEGDDYVERVVHIEFNSWHYSDSNLWASFVTKIFEDLESYGKDHPDTVKSLFSQLNSSGEFLAEANTKLQSIGATITTLENELSEKKAEISKKAQQLSGIKLSDIAAKVLRNPEVEKKLDEIKTLLPQRELNNLSDIYRSVKELDGFVNKFIETIKLFLSFKSWKSWVALLVFLIICTSPLWLFAFFKVHINDFFNWFGKYSAPVAILFANLAGIAAYATSGLNKVQEKLKSIAGSCAELEKESLAMRQSEVDEIQAELDMQKQAHIQKEAEINKLKKEQAEIKATIDDIQSGKKLLSFITSRVTDEKYISSLGLISWIRKDFQKLDELLKKQRELNKLREKPREEKEKIFQVDRIVLYIDDLDRCNEEVVVKVLEAIHLLLAFELFVVVVGVDPRWMHNALENKYRKQLKKHIGLKNDENKTDTSTALDEASSYDYLEKIFQVPLSLKEINQAGKCKLIDEQLKIKEQQVQTEPGKPDIKTIIDTEIKIPSGEEKKPADDNNELPPQPKVVPEMTQKQEAEKKQNEMAVKRAKEMLVISPDEIKFMKDITDLIGNSPRTVNRYVNIYRIIRSHRNLNTTNFPIQDYCAIMILLGIVTGLPNESEKFFSELAQVKTGTFESFVNKTGDEFQSLKSACKVLFKISETSQKTVGKLTIKFMKQKFELVQRFSFRAYDGYEIPPATSQKKESKLQKK